jgi:Tol biopolymer transport system component
MCGSHYPLAGSAIGSCSVAVGPGNISRMAHALATVATAAAVATLALAGSEATAAPPVSGPEHVAWASSHEIVFTAWGHGIYAISPSGGRPRPLASGDGDSLLSIRRDGMVLYGKGSSLLSTPIAGGKPRNLGFGFYGVWSPDGRRIAFTGNDGFMVEDADGRHRRLAARNRYGDSTGAPTWSPDGRKLAYVACRAAFLSDPCEHQYGFDVYVIGLDGSDKHRVTQKAGFPQCPAWSSSGKLAFNAADDLVAIVTKGGGLRTLHPGGCPVWAPGGRRFAVATGTGAYVMNFDGSDRKQISVAPHSLAISTGLAWSPDGKWLAVVDGSDPRSHLWVVRADGTGLRRVL